MKYATEYVALSSWCTDPRINWTCPQQNDSTKLISRLWEELHYYQTALLDELIEKIEQREHISSNKEAALRRLRPWLEKIFGSQHEIADPDFVVSDRQRNQQRAARKGQPSIPELDDSISEEITMSKNEVEVTSKKKKAAVADKEVSSKKEAPAADGVGLGDIAKKMKVDAADLRRALRSSKIKKPGGSWNWAKGHADLKAVEKLASSLKG